MNRAPTYRERAEALEAELMAAKQARAHAGLRDSVLIDYRYRFGLWAFSSIVVLGTLVGVGRKLGPVGVAGVVLLAPIAIVYICMWGYYSIRLGAGGAELAWIKLMSWLRRDQS